MQVDFVPLSTRSEAIPVVAQWWCNEWGLPKRHKSLDSYLTELRNSDPERLPLHMIATIDEQVVGVATLKDKNNLQARFSRFQYWLSGVYVLPALRRKGIATDLCIEAINAAGQRGISKLYLQTEALDGGLYRKIGWKPVSRKQSNDNVHILIMVRDVAPTVDLE